MASLDHNELICKDSQPRLTQWVSHPQVTKFGCLSTWRIWFVNDKYGSQIRLWPHKRHPMPHIDGSVQDCSNSSALAMELLQSCTKPSIFSRRLWSVLLGETRPKSPNCNDFYQNNNKGLHQGYNFKPIPNPPTCFKSHKRLVLFLVGTMETLLSLNHLSVKYHSQAFKISLQCFSQITDPDTNFLLKGNLLIKLL